MPSNWFCGIEVNGMNGCQSADIASLVGEVVLANKDEEGSVQVAAFDGRIHAGALAIGSDSTDHCMNILYRCKGERFIASASFPVPDPLPQTFTLPRVIFSVLTWSIINSIKSTLRSTKTSFFTATELLGHEIEPEIFGKFLPSALARAKYMCAPNAEVVGAGLEHIQEAFDTLGKGVSAKKIVVTLP